ncbi:MAG: hypothetical protein ACXVCP_01825 [Bdellovibrio sp.]
MFEITNKLSSKLFRFKKFHRTTQVTKKFIIICFFTLNISIMIVDGLPDRSALGGKFINLVAQYQAWAMLYQPWAMFAPNPMNTNAYVNAELQFEDGTTQEWPLLRQRLLQNPRRILVGDRYRIFSQETLLPNRNELAWFDISKYIARQVAQQEKEGQKRTLKQIIFKRFYNTVIPPPKGIFIPHGTFSSFYQSEPVFYYLPTTLEKVTYEAKNSSQIH